MRHSRLWLAATIIALALIIGFVLSVPRTRDIGDTSLPQSVVAGVPSVALRDSFKKGVHTITGSIEAPNACAVVSANAAHLNEASSTESILLEISLPEDAGVCLQMPTPMSFSATVSAPADLPITVTVNGAPATATAL